MVDSKERQHRPRTTRQLANRAIDAVERMGHDPEHYHEAVRVLVAYMELQHGDTPDCPHCDRELQPYDGARYKCGRRDCPGPPYVPWYVVVGLDTEPGGLNVDSPIGSGTNESHRGAAVNR